MSRSPSSDQIKSPLNSALNCIFMSPDDKTFVSVRLHRFIRLKKIFRANFPEKILSEKNSQKKFSNGGARRS